MYTHVCVYVFVSFSFCLCACLSCVLIRWGFSSALFMAASVMQRMCPHKGSTLINSHCWMTEIMKSRLPLLAPEIHFTYGYEWAHGGSQNENTLLNISDLLDYIFKGSTVYSTSEWQESSLCTIDMIFQQAIRIKRLFFKSVALVQVAKQNKTTISIVKFRKANFWYSNSSV